MSKTNASETCSARIPELFGSMVFNDHVMKERLPKGTYQALRQTMELGTALDTPVSYTHLDCANQPIHGVLQWAEEVEPCRTAT